MDARVVWWMYGAFRFHYGPAGPSGCSGVETGSGGGAVCLRPDSERPSGGRVTLLFRQTSAIHAAVRVQQHQARRRIRAFPGPRGLIPPIVADTGGLLRALARTPAGRPSFPEYERILTSAAAVIVPGL